jgi:hypothetical protein
MLVLQGPWSPGRGTLIWGLDSRLPLSLAVGEDVLDEEEMAELVAAKAPLVRLRGRWMAVDRLRRGPQFLHQPRRAPTAAEMLALATTHSDDPEFAAPAR